MSVEQRPPAETSAAELVATQRRSRSERAADSASARPPNVGRTAHSSLAEPPLHARIERTQLQVQVAALERALEMSEHRRQTVIDRYEHLLADRESSATESSTSSTRSASALKRLLSVWH